MYSAELLTANIKARAKEKKILIRDMLETCGLSINAISQVTDKKGLSSFALAKIADHLDCSVDYLLGRAHNHNSVPHYDASRNGAVDAKNAYQVYLADILHNSVTKATHRLSERDVRILNGYIQVAIFGQPIEQVKLENDELLIVEALIEAPIKIRTAPSKDGAVNSFAAYDGSTDTPAFSSQDETDAAPDFNT